MIKLYINLENCYGIKSLSHEFSFDRHHTHLIYAPNGMMKSSFANTLKNLFAKEKPKDRLHPDRISKYEVHVDGKAIQDGQIFVADPEDKNYDSSASFTNFLANAELKKQYDTIYADLNKLISAIMGPLSKISISSNCKDELLETFLTPNSNDNLFKILERLAVDIQNKTYINYSFRYNDVFDKGGKVKKFLANNIENLQEYITQYKSLISSSSVFRSVNGHTFGTHQASELEKFASSGNFFEVDHTITMHGGIVVSSIDELKQRFEEEKDAIFNNPELKKSFEKITKSVDGNQEVRAFKDIVTAQPEIILELTDYENFRKKTWLGYLSDDTVKQRLLDYYNYYQTQKQTLNDIILQAKSELPRWHKILEVYKDRFHVPFVVEIENQDDIILKQEAAKLVFKYKDDLGQEIPKPKDEIYNILSKGEQRAFYIMQLLFELESRKVSGSDSLIVFDDIADSFDYQNKYAIIEYLNDLNESDSNIFMLVLTHNFDFYRTLARRLGLEPTSWMCVKRYDETLALCNGLYQRDLFIHLLGKPTADRYFISLIPFVRNLKEYTSGSECDEYKKLTNCLHLKDETKTISESDVIDIITSYNRGKPYERARSDRSVYELIMSTADTIAAEPNPDEILIVNKIVLSIACRLKAEEYMKQKLLASGLSADDLKTTKDQTKAWTKLFKAHCTDDAKMSVIERVNMMTPELIHINSFMYEPLIDMSVHHLTRLYRDCSLLST